MAKILVVDDDKELTETIDEWLSEQGFAVDTANCGGDALGLLNRFPYDAVVIDWQMPDMTGIKVIETFRAGGNNTPIIMLTANSTIKDKETGFDVGADDYLTKPFHPRELTARLRSLIRRPREVAAEVLKVGDLTLDVSNFSAHRDGRDIQLSKKEFALLEYLMRHQGQVFNTDTLVDKLWASEKEASPDTVRVHITRLRAKVDPKGSRPLIHTVHGLGYKVEDRS